MVAACCGERFALSLLACLWLVTTCLLGFSWLVRSEAKHGKRLVVALDTVLQCRILCSSKGLQRVEVCSC